ncbi:BQ2448_6412 [Microbotryum intermedium]|uniref:BQ2448_6412 protein n=1 Tax=Microbotryum intermedium TaxID=269621 RepID=A0A238FJM3_9BASI|nr:BQ2448_6412 [Microbotryum intermedium]
MLLRYSMIIGRAISDVGAAGIFTSMMLQLGSLAQVTRLEDRPRLFGFSGPSSVFRPSLSPSLMVLTEHSS